MRRLILVVVFQTFFVINCVAQEQDHKHTVICYAGTSNSFTRIPPPDEFLQLSSSRTQMATIDVRYNGFSPEAQAAFQFAVDIWASQLVSDVTITIVASWQELGSGTLGTASPGETFRNFEGAPLPGVDYPAALAEKLARKELNAEGSADISANFNSTADWYFGTDGITPAGQFDLVSVVLHELGHGLGLTGSVGADQNLTLARWGDNQGIPRIYDFFLTNVLEEKMIDETIFENNSAEMLALVTSNNLFFNSPIASKVNSGQIPRVYAPSPYNPGSSISHLDENSFPAGNPNSLMTPFIGPAESIHDPGEVVMSIFAEMGWIYTFATVDPVKDTENTVDPIQVSIGIDSDNGIKSGGATLHYSLDNFVSESIETLNPGSANLYDVSLSNPGEGSTVSYYFMVEDVDDRFFRYPKEGNLSFFVGPDNEAPTLFHQPITDYFIDDPDPLVSTTVEDNVGVDTVYVNLFINDQLIESFGLNQLANSYSSTLPLAENGIQAGDEVRYEINAVDNSSQQNMTTEIVSFFAFGIVTSYENNFNMQGNDIISESFTINTPAGFENGAIHSIHPYFSPSIEADTVYSFQLKPIISIVNEGAFLSYDDIAMIEPGVEGSIFGISAFRDYVVVEGSKDLGQTWKVLNDGYDAWFDDDWLSLFNSQFDNGVSTGTPTSSLYKSHSFNLLNAFDVGDEIIFRFNLYANDAISGWGWAIDNVHIEGEGEITGLTRRSRQQLFNLYPNPANDRIHIDINNLDVKYVNGIIQLFDSKGRMVKESLVKELQNDRLSFSLADIPVGMYFLSIIVDNQLQTKKVVINR